MVIFTLRGAEKGIGSVGQDAGVWIVNSWSLKTSRHGDLNEIGG